MDIAAKVPTAEENTTPGSAPKRRWPVWIAAVLVLLAGAGYLLSQRSTSSDTGGGKGGGKKGKGGGATPVSVAKVTQGNMGVYINALGTVTPVYTNTITSRVAGQLMEVHYREGQIVHKGDLLAVIDSRPYEAAYVQAQGQLQRDEALLSNARIDLERYPAPSRSTPFPNRPSPPSNRPSINTRARRSWTRAMSMPLK